MKGMITLVLMMVLTFQVSAKNDFISGQGRFVSTDQDSLSFVKKQLLYSAFQDVISKELSSMGHNSELFWSKYNEKFDAYFSPIKEKLEKTYGKTEEAPLTGKQKESFDKNLRAKKLTLKSRYGKLNKVVSSYSIKKMSRSPQYPSSRYMSVQAKVNRKVLNDLYYTFTRGGATRNYKNLFITIHYRLKDMSWLDLGVELESDFTNALSEHWKRWFEDKFNGKVSNVIITTESEYEKLDTHLKMLSETRIPLSNVTDVEQSVESTDSSTILSVEDELKDSLWLKVQVNMDKISENTIFKKRTFKFGGEYLLFDLKANKLASHYDFISEEATFETTNAQKLSSNTASLVYRLPVAKWQELAKEVTHFPLGVQSFNLEVFGASSVRQIEEVQKHLATVGLTNNLKLKLESFDRDRAVVKLFYKGNVEELKLTILKSRNMEVDKMKVIIFKDESNPFAINLMDKMATEKSVNSNGQG